MIFSFASVFVTAQAADKDVPAQTATSSGQKVTLDYIDQLISQTDYNTALAYLSEYMQDHPSEFDLAQARVDKIVRARQEYSKLADQLIDVMIKEPENDEKKLTIINKLESLEKYPTEKNLAFIRQAKVAAQFTFFRAQFNRIMNDGANLVKRGEYTAAADKFSEGFVLYRGDFDDKKYGRDITEPVLRALDTINAGRARFPQMQDSCVSAYNAFMQAVSSGNYDSARTAFARVESSFKQYADVRNSVARGGRILQSTFASLQKSDPELTEASFLAFAQRFTLGRASDSESGIVGAMDAQWNRMVESMKPAVYNAVSAKLKTFSDRLPPEKLFTSSATHADARSQLVPARDFAMLGTDVQNLYSLIENGDGTTAASRFKTYNESMSYIADMTAGLSDRLDDVQTVSSLDTAVASRAGMSAGKSSEEDTVYGKAQLDSALSYEQVLFRVKSAQSAVWFTEEVSKEALAMQSASQPNSGAAVAADTNKTLSGQPAGSVSSLKTDNAILLWQNANDTFAQLCKLTSIAAQNGAAKVWGDVALVYAKQGENALTDFTVRYTDANNQFNGIDEKDTVSGETITKKYPSECVQALEKLQADIASERISLTEYQKTLSAGSAYKETSPSYVQGLNSIAATISALGQLSATGKTLAEKARAQVQLAERAKNEANLRYNEAVQALAKERFEDARSALERARTKYNESLSYQESAQLRKQSDNDLSNLGADVAKQENEVVVREVRTLKNDAKNAYYQGDFEKAEKDLTQARTRWAVTNVDEDKEITNLLALVSTALSMKTGRVIPPTAPLYPEMSQILSIANQYYDNGAKLMKQGKTAEAKDILAQAKEKLRTLQLVYPLNQEASLLTLRIDQLTDPSSFRTMFAQKVAAAKQDYKNPDKRQSAYTDLLDLSEINPSYPGLKQLIYDVEIDIGVRQKPVDNSALNRSKTLTAQAQRIYNSAGRDESKLRSALSSLDEAIRLNPNNDAAMSLKDRIQTSIGGQAAVVLSSADESVYQRAIQELQKNNIVTANALVEQLLQKPANKRSTKILELQKKVKALL